MEGRGNQPNITLDEAIAVFEVASRTRDERAWKNSQAAIQTVSGRIRDLKTVKALLRLTLELLRSESPGEALEVPDDKAAKEIAQRVGYGISPRRIQQYAQWFLLYRHGPQNLSSQQARVIEEKAHKEQLRELAVQLSEQARLNLMQVVRTEQIGGAMARLDTALPVKVAGLPELKLNPDTELGGNRGLIINRIASPPSISLVVEKHHAFHNLIEHLTEAFPVGPAFDGWKDGFSSAISIAMDLAQELRQLPELANEPWLEPEELATAKYGLLSHFTQTAVALACASHYPEIDVSHLRDGDFEITAEIQSSTGERYYKLSWKTPARFGLAFGLAIADDAETLKILESYHQNLCQALKENRQVTLLIRALKEAMDYERHLQGALTQVLRAESFPGRCPGCRPYTSET